MKIKDATDIRWKQRLDNFHRTFKNLDIAATISRKICALFYPEFALFAERFRELAA